MQSKHWLKAVIFQLPSLQCLKGVVMRAETSVYTIQSLHKEVLLLLSIVTCPEHIFPSINSFKSAVWKIKE